ncbi:MAG: cystathionine beta-lyase [Alphaproteobacteria bacterium]|nr:cystathionine beta-lyase [Alphaproteobacteria bacterium]
MTKAEGNTHADAVLKAETRVTIGGRNPHAHHGYVNPPVYHASTVLYRTAEDYLASNGPYFYGRLGTPTSEALEKAIQSVEGPECAAVALLPSGLAAISTALLSVLKSGDHVLATDSIYGPGRTFCDTMLQRYGVTTSYYNPLIGSGIAALMQPNTRAVYTEAPGSLTFEMQDIPAIAEAAHSNNALVLMDNTWAGPLHFKALEKGVDLSIQSGSKYIGGHCDVMLGTVSANKETAQRLKDTVFTMGLCVGPDDMNLALRGLRTLAVRLRQHHQSGLKVAEWLAQRPEVLRVLHPALPGAPGYDIWKRDFTGACGLFGIILKPVPEKAVFAFLNALTLYGLGASWGGYESLAIPYGVTGYRSATQWSPGGPAVRFHIGLEDAGDLIADLERGFAALAVAK